ncbi:MAG: heavy-metal-associated domain-containing protein [Flavobacteriaceae bacterium]
MKQVVKISGMTCNNCLNTVTEKMSSIKGLTAVEVSLKKGEASFNSATFISPQHIEEKLGAKYKVSLLDDSLGSSPSKWRQLRPLFLIFLYVIAGGVYLSEGESLRAFMIHFMGLFYIVFSFFKFLDYRSFPASFQQYDPIAQRLPFYAWIYPFIETGLGLLFLMEWQIDLALWSTLFILGSTSLGVVRQLRKKTSIQCACLGTVLDLPMTEATLIENCIMLFMAVGMLLGVI